MSPTRPAPTTRPALTALFAVGCLALGACSSSDDTVAPPRASGGASGAETPAPTESAPDSSAPTAASPSVEPRTLGAADLPAGSDLVLAVELDTNAPVDRSALDGTVTPSQVQAMRRAWNVRQVAVDAAAAGYCETPSDGIWVGVSAVEGGAPVLFFGLVGTGSSFSCDLDEAVLVVDSATREVLGDSAVGNLL